MGRSIYKLNRKKIEFHNASFFRVGDEFKTINGKIVYSRVPDKVRGSPSQYDSNTYTIKEPMKIKIKTPYAFGVCSENVRIEA